jgi:tRNA 2-thiouridine synthesizing protein C
MNESTGGIDMDEESSGTVKKFAFINRKAPYGTIYALESLEVVLISAASAWCSPTMVFFS